MLYTLRSVLENVYEYDLTRLSFIKISHKLYCFLSVPVSTIPALCSKCSLQKLVEDLIWLKTVSIKFSLHFHLDSSWASSGRLVGVPLAFDWGPLDVPLAHMMFIEGLKPTSDLVLFERKGCVSFVLFIWTSNRQSLDASMPMRKMQCNLFRKIQNRKLLRRINRICKTLLLLLNNAKN